jgi:transcriptional regulator with XRE-family HTH domain
MNYYQRLRDIREDRDLTQAAIAQVLGIKQSDYSKYELGKHMMGIDKYLVLAKYYNVSIDYLAGAIDEVRPLYRTAIKPQK